nr:EF-Hand 1, calcium-binding site-containing protein [Tanacetum cinerariifolium]
MGLLLLLPQILHPEKSETGHDDTLDKENLKKKLVDLEQKLIHATINVHRTISFNVYLILSMLNQIHETRYSETEVFQRVKIL